METQINFISKEINKLNLEDRKTALQILNRIKYELIEKTIGKQLYKFDLKSLNEISGHINQLNKQ